VRPRSRKRARESGFRGCGPCERSRLLMMEPS
jgi:hypothetical protein